MESFAECLSLWYDVQQKMFGVSNLRYNEAYKKGFNFTMNFLAMTPHEKEIFKVDLKYTLDNLPEPSNFFFNSNGSLEELSLSESEPDSDSEWEDFFV